MKCSVCGKEFGKGANCQNCGIDRITGGGVYKGFQPPPRSCTVNTSDLVSHSTDTSESPVTDDKMTVCHFCNEIIPSNSLFCPKCGKGLYVTCCRCHKQYSSEFAEGFCPFCGAKSKSLLAKEDYEDWVETGKENTISAYYNYVSKHPDGAFCSLANAEIDWRDASRSNTEGSYKKFIGKHRNGPYWEIAVKRLEALLWDKIQKGGTLENTDDYLRNIPARLRSKEFTAIRDNICQERIELAEKNQDSSTIEQIASNLEDKKNSKLAVEARERMRLALERKIEGLNKKKEMQAWENAERSECLKEYKRYLERFPNGAHASDSKDKIAQIIKNTIDRAYLNAVNIGTAEALASFYTFALQTENSEYALGRLSQNEMYVSSVNWLNGMINKCYRYQSNIWYYAKSLLLIFFTLGFVAETITALGNQEFNSEIIFVWILFLLFLLYLWFIHKNNWNEIRYQKYYIKWYKKKSSPSEKKISPILYCAIEQIIKNYTSCGRNYPIQAIVKKALQDLSDKKN